jgi:hypothetical protein
MKINWIIILGLLFLTFSLFPNQVAAPTGNSTCTDSDGGINYYVPGTISGVYDGSNFSYYDYCENSIKLVEKYCGDPQSPSPSGVYYECPYACEDGACTNASSIKVTATLDGNAWSGPVIFDISRYADFSGMDATGQYTLPKEFYILASGHPVYIRYRAEGGFQSGPEGAYLYQVTGACGKTGNPSTGPCVTPTSFIFEFKTSQANQTCTDSDGGRNYYVKGQTTSYPVGGTGGTFIDYCTDSTGATSSDTGDYVGEWWCYTDDTVHEDVYKCPNGCKDGACINASCIGEGQSLGPVVPENKNVCCPGLTAIGAYSPANCQPMLGTYGYCTKCGDGVCKEPENICNCPADCKTTRCPVLIDMIFNKKVYYAGDYFEVVVKIYDENKNLIPNQVFNIYNDKMGASSTYYTDSTGIYKTTSTVPSDPQFNGEWAFVASVNEGGCNYIADKETIYINISNKCGDGYCDDSEKEIVCDNVCAQVMCEAGKECPIMPCKLSCHVKCMKDCTPNCGNGVCDSATCLAVGCPVPENERNCPQDCARPNYCGSQSSDPNCMCEEGYIKESFQAPCGMTTTSQSVTGGASAATGTSMTGAMTASSGCTDSDGGKNYYTKGTIVASNLNPPTNTDYCIKDREPNAPIEEQHWLIEYYCSSENTGSYQSYGCPTLDCNDGACVECSSDLDCPELSCPEGSLVHELCVEGQCVLKAQCPNTVKEQVKCIFKNSNFEQKCYSSNGFGCSGVGACVADVYGTSGEKVAWKSTCGGYAYTIIDGVNEYADFDCSSTQMCTYYRCVSAYQYFDIYTDKYSYGLNEPVSISTSPVDESHLGVRELEVYVRKPYGSGETVALTASCETAETACSCEIGAYCPPCTPKTWCKYKGTFTGTDEVGGYEIGSNSKTTADFKIRPAYFTVYDEALLKKYLILENIDGFMYKSAQVMPAPENITGYMALYEKIGRQYNAIVFDFETREQLQQMLNMVLQQNPSYSEEKFDGYYIYALKNYGQKVYFWTFKNFLVAVMENMGYAQKAESVLPTPPQPSAPELTGTAERTLQKTEIQKESGFFTGMITGMPFAAESGGAVPKVEAPNKYCGSDSLYSECACAGDETKEKFMPSCKPGSACDAVPHYRCVPTEPKELIKAYLDKYPSDTKAIGTDCEQKDGYCIYFQDSCKSGFEETSLACNSKSEKCCVKEVNKDDFIEIVFKLEGIRVRMDSFERKANALADYYRSVGDEERANKFSEVAGMFANAKNMVDDIIAKIRANLENPELIRDEIKQDVLDLRRYISGILGVMVA